MAVLGWLRRLLSADRAREDSAPAHGAPVGGTIQIDAERIDAARDRLKESIPPPPDPEA